MEQTNTDTGPAALDDGITAAERMRYEQEIRRLRRDLESRDQALRDLGRRLHQAEVEAASTGSRVIAEARATFEQRAVTAEAQLAELQRTKLFRMAAPLRTAYGRARRGQGLAGKLLRR